MYCLSSLFATVLFATVLKVSSTSETIFITTNSSSDHECPAEPCLTLQEFVSHYHSVKSNTVLKFLPGQHVVLFNTSKNISITNVDNITLTGVSDQQSSVIHCMSEFSVIAINVQNLTISSLHFSGCGGPIQEGLKAVFGTSNVLRSPTLFATLRSTTLFLSLVSNVSVQQTHVYDSKGAGMLAVNTHNFILNNTSFVGNIQNCVIWFFPHRTPSNLHVSLSISKL